VSTRERRSRRPQHADDDLLGAAAAVFAREGFAAATVDRIAAEAGTTKPTLYARFGSKADLYDAVVRHEAEAIRSHLFDAYGRAAHLSVDDFTREAVHAWFTFAVQRPNAMKLLFVGDHVGTHSPVPAEITQTITTRVAEAVEDYALRANAAAGPAAEVLAAMIVGTVVHAVRRCFADPSLDPVKVADLATAFLTNAFRGLDAALLAVEQDRPLQGRTPRAAR
jgi:AcrR family transcriptional regulator